MSSLPTCKLPSPAKQNEGVPLKHRRMCDNCHCTSCPMWRPEWSIQLTFCNACSIWWRTKRSLRPKPTPEELARKAELKAAKQAAAAAAATAANPKGSYEDQLSSGQPIKRRRRARNWGEDIQVYFDGQDDWEPEDRPVGSKRHATKSIASAEEQVGMTAEQAAFVILSFKAPAIPKENANATRITRATRAVKETDIQGVGLGNGSKTDGQIPRHNAHCAAIKETEEQADFICPMSAELMPPPVAVLRSKIRAMQAPNPRTTPSVIKCCSNCGATDTPAWRRAGGAQPLCNACGVYRSTHGSDRPPPMPVPLQAVTRPKATESAGPAYELIDLVCPPAPKKPCIAEGRTAAQPISEKPAPKMLRLEVPTRADVQIKASLLEVAAAAYRAVSPNVDYVPPESEPALPSTRSKPTSRSSQGVKICIHAFASNPREHRQTIKEGVPPPPHA